MEAPEARGGLLVVDDEPFLREAVAASLRFLGFQVTTADTAADALRLARDRPFDLVVLDVLLPDGDGFEVVRRLRRDGFGVPVIFLTARDTEADKVAGLSLGGDDYMTKPVGLEELAARVRTVLRRTMPPGRRARALPPGRCSDSPTWSWTSTATRCAGTVIPSSCRRPSSGCCGT